MIGTEVSRIVEAMRDLKERRDGGELVHEVLDEVAADHRVSIGELKKRAEASWGIPLETEGLRHASHFAVVRSVAETARDAREFAKLIYENNLPYVRKHKGWEVNWEHEIDSALKTVHFEDPALEHVARQEFLDASTHFNVILKHVRKSHAQN